MTLDGDTSEAAFFPCYTMTWIAIIISRLCVILAQWQVLTHAQELEVSLQGQRYLPRHSISDAKCEWHATVRLCNSRGCLLWSLQQIPLKAGDWSTISSDSPSNLNHLPFLFFWKWGWRQCYLSWGSANINEWNQALEKFTWKVLFSCVRVAYCLCSPRPILIIRHGQPVKSPNPRI